MKTNVFAGLILTLGLCACQSAQVKESASQPIVATHASPVHEAAPPAVSTAAWFNPDAFGQAGTIGETLDDVQFDITLHDSDGSTLQLTRCMDLIGVVTHAQYSRLQRVQANCEAANRYFRTPTSALDFWPESLTFDALKTFPATVIPGAITDTPSTNLGERSDLQPVAGKAHSLKVFLGQLEVIYVVLAKGDFNQDGYQDWFMRLDWTITDSTVEGVDWVVLTKRSANQAPFVLWRK